METLYDVLEVSNKASKEVIEKAYKTLAKRYHPDLQESSNRKSAEEKMKKINDAYSVLSDDAKREEYDRSLQEEMERLQREKQQSENQKRREQQTANEAPRNNQQTIKNKYNNEEFNWIEYYNRLTRREQRKVKKHIERDARNEYRNLYENYFRSLGYRVPHKWTLKEVKMFFLVIITIIILFIILWLVPVSHDWMVNLYNSNVFVQIIVNLFIGIMKGIKEFFKSIFVIR